MAAPGPLSTDTSSVTSSPISSASNSSTPTDTASKTTSTPSTSAPPITSSTSDTSTTTTSPTTTSPTATSPSADSTTANTTTSGSVVVSNPSTPSTPVPPSPNPSKPAATPTTTIPSTIVTPTSPPGATSSVSIVIQSTTTTLSETTSPTPSSSSVHTNSTTNGFFSNTSAVAGVFTIVGIIGLAVLVALLLCVVRRRRARNFDKELIAATREAAATAPNPVFLDDEEDGEDRFKQSGYSLGYGSGGGSGYNAENIAPSRYSDNSHGTFGQPPMEAFSMRDLGSPGIGVGEIYDPSLAGGAAGIGVARARSMRLDPANANINPYAAALQEGGSPYPKFAIGPHDMYAGGAGAPPLGRGTNTNMDPMEAHGQQQQYQQGSPPQEYANLGRNKSNSTNTTHTQLYPASISSPPSQSHAPSYPQQAHPVRQMSPSQGSHAPSSFPAGPASLTLPNPHSAEPSRADAGDAYGGYVVDSPTAANEQPQANGAKYMANPFDSGHEGEDGRDEEEEMEAPRVLKVANE